MTRRTKTIVTLCLLVFLCVLGIADYEFSGDRYLASVDDTSQQTSASSETSSADTGVAKQSGIDVEQVLNNHGFVTEKSADQSFIAQVATRDAILKSLTILKDNDRAGSVTWIESSQVKSSFIALKEALLAAFSPLVSDLHDETDESPDGPTQNILSFTDPSLSTEHLMFVRVRERLYEFHIAQGKEDAMKEVADIVTK